MIARHAATLAATLVATGCNLYFAEDLVPSPDAPSPDAPAPPGDGGSPGDAGSGFAFTPLALPCIHEVVGGNLLPGGRHELLVIRACEGGPIIAAVIADGRLAEQNPRADWRHQYRHASVVDADRRAANDIVTTADNGLDAGLFWSGGAASWNWRSLQFYRRFTDLAVGDLTPIGPHPTLVVGGDNALRLVRQTESYAPSFPYDIPPSAEIEVLSGRNIERVAIADLGGSAAADVFFIARSSTGLELGAAVQTAAAPPTFSARTLLDRPLGPVLPLLTADVDGDGKADVIGAIPELFVHGSRHGAIVFLGQPAAELAVGDVDGDGAADILFVTADRSAVRRLVADGGGAALTLAAVPWLPSGGDRLVIADLDGDDHDDVVVLRDRGLPASRLVPYRSP